MSSHNFYLTKEIMTPVVQQSVSTKLTVAKHRSTRLSKWVAKHTWGKFFLHTDYYTPRNEHTQTQQIIHKKSIQHNRFTIATGHVFHSQNVSVQMTFVY